MWPSESLASRIYDAANWGLVISLTVGVISTVLIVWMGNVKEEVLRRHLSDTAAGAAAANERAGNAAESAGVANDHANALAADNIGLQRHVASLQLEAARQQERAATAEKQLTELKERLRPRGLTPEQQSLLAGLVAAYPKETIYIYCMAGDAEGKRFAMQIEAAFRRAGWIIGDQGVTQMTLAGVSDPTGLAIIVHNPDTAPLWVFRIRSAFASIGVELTGRVDPDQSEGR